MQTDTGGPAFPMSVSVENYSDGACQLDLRIPDGAYGMTLLDWFAGQACVGLLASGPHDCGPDGIEHDAYSHAAAMLAEKRRREAVESAR